IAYRPEETSASPGEAPAPAPAPVEPDPGQHALLESIARELTTAELLHARVSPPQPRRPRSALAAPPEPPRDELERALAALCEEVLGVDGIGVNDDLFLDFGADSLAGLRIAARIREALKRPVQTVTVLEAR